MNNGRRSTTTGIWWVKHLAMMDGWGPVLVPRSTTIHVSYTAPQKPKHMSKQKHYLSPKVQLLESSAQAFAIQFLGGDLLLFACFGLFSWLFFCCCLLSWRPLKPQTSLPWLLSKMGPDSKTETEFWPEVFLEAACLNLGHAAHWFATKLLWDNWFFFDKVVLHFMCPYLIFHRTTHEWMNSECHDGLLPLTAEQVMACLEKHKPNLVVLKLNTLRHCYKRITLTNVTH